MGCKFHEGPPRYFLPICVQTPMGFLGGPSGYQEVGEDERDRGSVIVAAADVDRHETGRGPPVAGRPGDAGTEAAVVFGAE